VDGSILGALLPLVVMLGFIGLCALQLRRPADTHVRVGNGRLVVTLEGWDAVWTFRRRVDVPLTQVVDMAVADAADVPRRGMRMPGTALPGVIRAGSYGSGERRELWNVRRARRVLVVDLHPPQPYRRLVIEVADPDSVATDLRRAVAEARAHPA
jgi:hypothetical protein